MIQADGRNSPVRRVHTHTSDGQEGHDHLLRLRHGPATRPAVSLDSSSVPEARSPPQFGTTRFSRARTIWLLQTGRKDHPRRTRRTRRISRVRPTRISPWPATTRTAHSTRASDGTGLVTTHVPGNNWAVISGMTSPARRQDRDRRDRSDRLQRFAALLNSSWHGTTPTEAWTRPSAHGGLVDLTTRSREGRDVAMQPDGKIVAGATDHRPLPGDSLRPPSIQSRRETRYHLRHRRRGEDVYNERRDRSTARLTLQADGKILAGGASQYVPGERIRAYRRPLQHRRQPRHGVRQRRDRHGTRQRVVLRRSRHPAGRRQDRRGWREPRQRRPVRAGPIPGR